MNPTLYTQLSPLGFAEWLNKKLNAKIYFNKWMTEKDKLPLDSIGRTELNALAFRWLREEKKLDFYILPTIIMYKRKYTFRHLNFQGSLISPSPKENNYDTHPLAEHEALNKALEILSKGGDDGNV